MTVGNDHHALWVLVPARGGSKGIPRKNLRQLAGKPLIVYSLMELSTILDKRHIVVSTDSDEIAAVCEPFSTIHVRSSTLADDRSTLDEVAVDVARWLLDNGAQLDDYYLTIQPTSPFIRATSLVKSVEALAGGARSVLSVKDDRHLRWTMDENGIAIPLYEKRINRQWLPPTFGETGGIIGARIGDVLATGTRIHTPVALVEINAIEGLDIDSYADWMVAEYYATRKRIIIRADAAPTLGMGHVYRAVALAHEFSEHDVLLISRSDGQFALGANFLAGFPYPLETLDSEDIFFQLLIDRRPDIAILDILDTEAMYVNKVKEYASTVVSLEDLGPGSRCAHIVINDLYTDLYPQHNHWYGVEYAILSPQFETVVPRNDISENVQNVLVAFGGTDPNNLTVKALHALSQVGCAATVTVVLGPGYSHGEVSLEEFSLQGQVLRSVQNMAQVMRQVDIAITSAGRTVTELMTLGVPTLVMCQNSRELRHTHASSPFGVMNLGLGEHIESSTLAQHVALLLSDAHLRSDMRQRALRATQNRSNRTIAQKILATHQQTAN